MEQKERERIRVTMALLEDMEAKKPEDVTLDEALHAVTARMGCIIALELDRIAGHLNRIAGAAETMEDK